MKDTNMSHNVYSGNKKITLKDLPNYMICNNKQIYVADSITLAIEIAKTEKCICSIYALNGTMGKYYEHLIDCSKGVLW